MNKWIDINKRVPEYDKEVMVYRPMVDDIIMAYFHKCPEGGKSHGYMGREITHEDYWSVPAILTKSVVTYWQPIPKPPKIK